MELIKKNRTKNFDKNELQLLFPVVLRSRKTQRFNGESRLLAGVVAKVLDSDIVISEFELQSWYDVHFHKFPKVWTPLIPCTTDLLKDGCGIEYPTKVDIPLTKEIAIKNSKRIFF